MGKRQTAAIQTRKNVVAAAKKLIEEKGFENISVADIAAAAGVAKGTFYTYFKRKEDIVAELTRINFEPIEEKSRTMEGSIDDKLKSFLIDSMQRIVDSGLKLARQWLVNAMDLTLGIGADKLNYDMDVIRNLLETAVNDGELSSEIPIEKAYLWITAEYYGALTCWSISDGSINPVDLLCGYCDSQLKSFLLQYKCEKR